ncbi:MAG: C39 family peptidase [Candidatus Doudnabacteria bacterium]|nr:C39 family peptidase [Candidatus Doudnabacteria bacterium]
MKRRLALPKLFIGFCLILLAGTAAYLVAVKYHRSQAYIPDPKHTYSPGKPAEIKTDYVMLNVPFVSQSPLARWDDPRQQDGCEEASILMAWLWINNKTMTKEEAEKAITDTADFEQDRYGSYHDTDAADTVQLMKDYYGYTNLTFKIDPTIEDIKNTLREGKLVLVPANGQKLGNPNYKPPGPLTHMLVIKGFDNSKNQFITNDPGTRLGDGYVYDYQTVYNAMVNYPTGHHESQDGRPKAMIIISK